MRFVLRAYRQLQMIAKQSLVECVPNEDVGNEKPRNLTWARSGKLDMEFLAHGMGEMLQDFNRNGCIFRVEQSIELQPAGVQPFRQDIFRYLPLPHDIGQLNRQ